jgi:hypothetical protein
MSSSSSLLSNLVFVFTLICRLLLSPSIDCCKRRSRFRTSSYYSSRRTRGAATIDVVFTHHRRCCLHCPLSSSSTLLSLSLVVVFFTLLRLQHAVVRLPHDCHSPSSSFSLSFVFTLRRRASSTCLSFSVIVVTLHPLSVIIKRCRHSSVSTNLCYLRLKPPSSMNDTQNKENG